MSIISGVQDEERDSIEFSYYATAATETEIEFKLEFKNPLVISQSSENPERLSVVVNLDGSTNLDGVSFEDKVTVLTSFVPRQIPSEAEAAAIASSGESSESASAAAMGSNFLVSLILAASLNQLWSMMNGL